MVEIATIRVISPVLIYGICVSKGMPRDILQRGVNGLLLRCVEDFARLRYGITSKGISKLKGLYEDRVFEKPLVIFNKHEPRAEKGLQFQQWQRLRSCGFFIHRQPLL